MKIVRLDLLAFGPFSDTRLELGAGREGLHLVHGPNEAGKTSALRALRHLFYGIPESTRDHFHHPPTKLRIGATLRDGNGTLFECVRRKGRKNTLLQPDGEPLDEAGLRQLLGGVDQAAFENTFAIDHDTLVRGGQELVEGGGDVGRILFAAGAGIGALHQVQQALEQEMEALFLDRGRNPRINQALADLDRTRKQVRDLELPSADWIKRDQALRDALARKTEVERRLDEHEREKQRLQRLREALPALAERQTRLAEREALADAVLLPEDFAEQRRAASSSLSQAREMEKEATRALQQLDADLTLLRDSVPEALLDQAASIEDLHKHLGSHLKAHKDRARLEIELRRLDADAGEMLRRLRPGLTLERAEELRLGVAERARIQGLCHQYPALARALQSAGEARARFLAKIEDADRRLADLESTRDAEELRRVLQRMQSATDLDKQGTQSRAELRRLEQQAAIDRGSLPLWTGSLDELETLHVPATETIDRFEEELAEADHAVANLSARLDELHGERLELERRLEQLRREQDVPTEADLESARRRRDEGWRLVRDAWQLEVSDTGVLADFLKNEEARDLGEAYERSVRRADELADRLRREADRVATHARLRAEHMKTSQRLELAREQHRAAEERQRRRREAWAELWQPLAIVPRTPREMRAWTRRWAALLTQQQSLRNLRDQVADLEERLAAQRRDLSGCLRVLGEPADAALEPLADLLARGRQLLEHLDSVSDQRRQLQRDRAAFAGDLQLADAQETRARADLDHWQSAWTDAVHLLGLPATATVDEAQAVLAGIVDVLAKLHEADSHRERIAGIDRDSVAFVNDVRALSANLAPAQRDDPVDQVVEGLNARLTRARTAAAQLQDRAAQREREEHKLLAARRTIADMAGRLAELCREARCASPEALPQAEERSQRLRRLAADLRRLEETLLQRSGGAPLADFLDELRQVEPDTLAPRLRRLEEELAAVKKDKEELDQAIGSARALLEKMDGSARAAEAAELSQTLLAQIGADAEHYVRLRLAAVVLRRGIERYREKNQTPLLRRAGELFARLTLDSFAGLRVERGDDGQAVLRGLRSGGDLVDLPGMSEGTRDQLYLSLRLALLETYLDRHEPLPFIVDDVLIHFDNARAVAVLQELAELSRRTQIIFFTHHAHLVELAEHHLDGDVLYTYRLEPQTARGPRALTKSRK